MQLPFRTLGILKASFLFQRGVSSLQLLHLQCVQISFAQGRERHGPSGLQLHGGEGVISKEGGGQQAGLACMIYEALLTCVLLPFSLRLCGIIAGLLPLLRAVLQSTLSRPRSICCIEPPFPVWYVYASLQTYSFEKCPNI